MAARRRPWRCVQIGQGTYSSVFRARNLETGRLVALKKVRFDSLEPESVRFMAREILILRRLRHPNVVGLDGLITSRSFSEPQVGDPTAAEGLATAAESRRHRRRRWGRRQWRREEDRGKEDGSMVNTEKNCAAGHPEPYKQRQKNITQTRR
ncbi:hypothetical protein GUJ93_ZPchr0003g18258 [Zizania palustris]|uniref:[RNA-polymerase]-subunit kinase n=1 Tax=Zizania palustris TaxID=103762 RepID=A0A8J5S2K6_ZIZPA|nr:hypothetical protein GUJ93_ZPchr0003g18258 [Zizania palustris]